MHIVTTHKNTDFDALASTIAATLVYPGTLPVLPKTLNPNVKAFLSIHKDVFPFFTPDQIEIDKVTRLVVVDVNDWERLDRMETLRSKPGLEILLWDHHQKAGTIAADWACHEGKGATTTLLVNRIKEEGIDLSPIQATLLLTGIYEDTGNLTFPSCTADDAYAAGFLLEQKADLAVISRFLRPAYGEKQKEVLFEMLQGGKITRINGHSVSINTVSIQGHVDGLAVVVRMAQDILNVDAAFGIFSDAQRGHCMVIGRSHVDSLDVGAIMRRLGGGGHSQAASAFLKTIAPEAVEERIREIISGHQKSSVQISDLMSFPVATVDEDMPMQVVAETLRKKGFTGLPVVDRNGKLVGIISRRDFRRVKKESQLTAPAKAFMSRNVLTIAPGKSPVTAARMMVKNDVGRLPVVEDGKIIGIVTRSDAMLYFYDLLPE